MRKIYLAIILLLCAAGCSKVDSSLVGMWQWSSTEYIRGEPFKTRTTITILPDGTASYDGDA